MSSSDQTPGLDVDAEATSRVHADIEKVVQACLDRAHELKIFMGGVVDYIIDHPKLRSGTYPIVHSHKRRLKSEASIRRKIADKFRGGKRIVPDKALDEITDLAGVRILHLYQEDFRQIDALIRERIAGGDWVLGEKPKVYTWDPEVISFFERFELNIEQKDSAYTSVHYLIKPRSDSQICCEVQVRTLFEEIWGEVDHQLNYPVKSANISISEQIRVLSKITGAGSRLLDSIYRISK